MDIYTGTEFFQSVMESMNSQDYKLPKFQRGYVWSDDQCTNFFDSIIRGWPIGGTIVLWKRVNSTYIIDGQQRLLTMKRFYDGKFGFNLNTIKFEPMRDGLIPSNIFIDVISFLKYSEKFLSDNTGESNIKSKIEYIRLITDQFKSVKVSIIEVSNATFDEVKEVFNRYNLGGTPISEEEMKTLLQ